MGIQFFDKARHRSLDLEKVVRLWSIRPRKEGLSRFSSHSTNHKIVRISVGDIGESDGGHYNRGISRFILSSPDLEDTRNVMRLAIDHE